MQVYIIKNHGNPVAWRVMTAEEAARLRGVLASLSKDYEVAATTYGGI